MGRGRQCDIEGERGIWRERVNIREVGREEGGERGETERKREGWGEEERGMG